MGLKIYQYLCLQKKKKQKKKEYVANFTLKRLLGFEICACEIREQFVYKHSETIE